MPEVAERLADLVDADLRSGRRPRRPRAATLRSRAAVRREVKRPIWALHLPGKASRPSQPVTTSGLPGAGTVTYREFLESLRPNADLTPQY
ncbi:MAG: hypothetical protein R2717_07845 [Schumannella sp.]